VLIRVSSVAKLPMVWTLNQGVLMISERTAGRIHDLGLSGSCTQAAIAAELHVSRSTVGRVLRGKWKPRPFHRRQVRRLLQLWETAMPLCSSLRPGECRACGEPVYLPCAACLAYLLDLAGVRVSVRALRASCMCGGNFSRHAHRYRRNPSAPRVVRGVLVSPKPAAQPAAQPPG
jgi:DNA-binding XRE family transcriptional regulator